MFIICLICLWKIYAYNNTDTIMVSSMVSLGNYLGSYSSIEVKKLNVASIYENINLLYLFI